MAKCGNAFTVDCDPFNFYCSIATDRISALVSKPKFIISLRNPIDRAYSDFNMYRSRAGETRSFEQVIQAERSGEETRFRRRFVAQSIYAPHLRRWFDHFPRESFLVIDAEDLFSDPRSTASKVFSFLDLPDVDVEAVKMNAGDYSAPLLEEERARIREYLQPHFVDVYELLGRDMSW
ncbi:hypothetical protein GCM10009105_37440 [Dokdonella soli]|uniref:Sulfotransferase domain-containing protein n=2 Tax=Dokdonella soli TaxID=529810 RepID=A0ABN1IZP5_9GAMM